MRARLMAQASAEDAAAAQNTVNAAMTKALAMVRTLGLEVETGGYNTFQDRSEEHTSELQSLMRISYAVFCLKKKKQIINTQTTYEILYDKQSRRTNNNYNRDIMKHK